VTGDGAQDNSGPDGFDDDALKWRLEIVEGRRNHYDSYAWAVPGLALAAQAFLLQIALDPAVTPLARMLASLAGLVALLASAQLFAKHCYNFDLYEAVIERDRLRLASPLPSLQKSILTTERVFPSNTSYAERRWAEPYLWRHRLVVRLKSVTVWGIALVALLAIDGFLFVYSIVALAGADPGWLNSDLRR
jgi:hypothetical protein